MSTARLKDVLSRPITKPEEVTYLMVELRKYLERTNEFAKYPDMAFFINWTLHSSLTKSPLIETLAFQLATLFPEMKRVPEQLRQVISLEALNNGLKYLCVDNGLPQSLVENAGWWSAFSLMYYHVVEECPLKLTHGREIKAKLFLPSKKRQELNSVVITQWTLTMDGHILGQIYNEGYVEISKEIRTRSGLGQPITKTVKVLSAPLPPLRLP